MIGTRDEVARRWERAKPATRNRRKFSAQEIAADEKRYARELREKFKATSEFNRQQAVRVGCKTYIWQAVGDCDSCPDCAKNNGKRFQYAKAPKLGHPGERDCCALGWCRFWAEPSLPND